MQNKPNKNLTIKCMWCNKEFHPITPNQKYCCFSCRKLGAQRRRKENYKLKKDEFTNCLYCGMKIRADKNRKFCSDLCYKLYRNKKRSEENSKKIIENASTEQKCCSHECTSNHCLSYKDGKRCFTKDGFTVSIQKTEFGTYNWTATKNNKVMLKSSYCFCDMNSAYKDARKAFIS